MEPEELIRLQRDSFPVTLLQTMLGIKKTESYWILKHRDIETVMIRGQMRIVKSSFEEWYSGQTKYRIIGGPEPGERIKAMSFSVRDAGEMLSVSDDTIYTLVSRGCFETFKDDRRLRITKESFFRWYSGQNQYRLQEDRDENILSSTYSLPEIRRILGVHRNTVYYIVRKEGQKAAFDSVLLGSQVRITIESFERWLSSQTRYKRHDASEESQQQKEDPSEERTNVIIEERSTPASPPRRFEEKALYRIEDLMLGLGISKKAAYQLVATGEIIAVRAGKAFLIPAAEYKRYLGSEQDNGGDHQKE